MYIYIYICIYIKNSRGKSPRVEKFGGFPLFFSQSYHFRQILVIIIIIIIEQIYSNRTNINNNNNNHHI